MIPKSIKWRLQIWYGLILVLVLAGFGVTAYQLEYGRQMRLVDDELHRRFSVLATTLHPPRPPARGRFPFNRPPPDQMAEDLPPQPNAPPENFVLPPEAADLFGTNQPEGFYFMINSRDGGEIARGGNWPTFYGTNPYSLSKINRAPESIGPKPPSAWTENGFRQTFDMTPSGETILVGCSIVPELKELRRTAINLTSVGGLILLVGLAGGWWFVSRAIRPIEDISSAAVKISAGDLSQRINVAETESELGQLASVLNSTFARLDAAFAQQKQFASDAAHELRTPVSVILTQTQTALTRERDAASYKETVEACQRAAQRMRKLIRALLELARLDAGQESLKRLRFDFSSAVNECIALVKPIAEERGVKIFSELSPLEITGDSERLAQVVTNLLTNAIQYNKPGGEVRVKLESQNGMAVLAVSDTGAGIPRADLPHIFKRFYRGDKSRTGSGNTGLGLAIAKAIVEAHGGAIEVSSEEDTGTTFTVRLPEA
jgi:heavy metal sensor kinase